MAQNNTQAQRDELEITGKVQFTRKRDPMRAGNDAGEIAIFSVLFAAATYLAVRHSLSWGVSLQTLWILLGCGVYAVITAGFFRQKVLRLQWARDEIVATEDALYVRRAGRVIAKLCWQDVAEVGVVPMVSGGCGQNRMETVYIATRSLEQPPYLHPSNWRQYVDATDVIFFSTNSFACLKGLLPRFAPWVACMCDLNGLHRLLCEKSASAAYLRRDETVCRFMPCAVYEKLWAKEREKALLYDLKAGLGFAVIMAGFLLAVMLFF